MNPLRNWAQDKLDSWRDEDGPNPRSESPPAPVDEEHRSRVLAQALETYLRRKQDGETFDLDDFAAGYAPFAESVRKTLGVEMFMEGHATALKPGQPVWPMVGETINTFQLVRELGAGTFGRTFLALDRATDRPVVVKFSADGAAEARIMGQFDHPGVVPILSAEYHYARNLSTVCMPFLGAATLKDLLDAPDRTPGSILRAANGRAQPSDPPARTPSADPNLAREPYARGALRLMLEAAEALAYLHDRGVSHRDLKPTNILLGADGRPRLLDFNLAQDATTPTTGGTLAYMAPEQIGAVVLRDGSSVDARADLFALGVVGYELLSGQHPFGFPRRPTGSMALASHEVAFWLRGRQHAPARRLEEARLHGDRRLAHIVERCLAYDPAERPASAQELAAELRRLYERPERLRRHRRRIAVAIASAILLVGTAGAVWQFAPGKKPPESSLATARSAMDRGDFEAAEREFDRILDRDRNDLEARLHRGIARVRKNQLGSAQSDFFAVLNDRPDSPALDWAAYCLTRTQQHEAAVLHAGKVKSPGAAVLNNRGVSYSQQAAAERDHERMKAKLSSAQSDFVAAAALAPNHPTIHYNLALLAYTRWERQLDPTIAAAAMLDARIAAESATAPRQVLVLAARMHALAGEYASAVGYLRRAIAVGQKPEKLALDPAFRGLRDLPAFAELSRLAPGTPSAADVNRVIAPDEPL